MTIAAKARLAYPLLLWLLAMAVGLSQTPQAKRPKHNESGTVESDQIGNPDYKIIQEGISVEFEIEHVEPERRSQRQFQEGDLATFRFKIADTTSETPLSGVFPGAWMDARPAGEKPTDAQMCRDKAEAFIGGSLLTQPELDLNVYYVLSLNNDASISVVDPLFGFGTTKLLSMIFLKSPGEDWVLTPDQMTLFVSMPNSNQVAVADTSTWKVLTNLDVGPRPSRVALQPDARFIWVGNDAPREEGASSGVAVLDTQEQKLVKEIPTGRGHHEIAFSPDDRYAFVTNQKDGTLSVIDIRKLEKVKDVQIGAQPVSVAYSSISRAVYTVDRTKGTIVVVDGETHREIARIQSEPGLSEIKFAPGGRLGFVPNPEEDVVHILDASINRIIQTGDMAKGPDQIAFSDELAYVRHRDSETIMMIPLDKVGKEGDRVPVVDFPGGQTPFGKGAKASLAASIVQAPGANAVLVANPADRTIYYYREGMAAPMGQFQNYGRQPRAVLAVDRSLEERSAGSYETTATLRRPGLYDVVFFLDSPRTIHCFPVRVNPNPALMAARAREKRVNIEPAIERRVFQVGEPVTLKFKLTDPVTREPKNGLRDVNVLSFRAPGSDQKRQWATPRGEGFYEVPFESSRPGVYYIFVACPSLGLRYNKSPFLTLRVKERSGEESSGPGGD